MLGQGKVTMNVYLVAIIGVLVIWGSLATGIVIGRDLLPSPQAAPGATGGSSTFRMGRTAPIRSALVTVDGKPTSLALGRKATVVVAMATWCKFCGYMDKWVLPVVAKEAGVEVDVVDVSQVGGIANPGPQHPAFSGSDGQGGTTLSESGMEADLRGYVAKYKLASSGINFYVAPASIQEQWHVSAFPTVVVLNPQGIVTQQQTGAMTATQLAAAVAGASAN